MLNKSSNISVITSRLLIIWVLERERVTWMREYREIWDNFFTSIKYIPWSIKFLVINAWSNACKEYLWKVSYLLMCVCVSDNFSNSSEGIYKLWYFHIDTNNVILNSFWNFEAKRLSFQIITNKQIINFLCYKSWILKYFSAFLEKIFQTYKHVRVSIIIWL